VEAAVEAEADLWPNLLMVIANQVIARELKDIQKARNTYLLLLTMKLVATNNHSEYVDVVNDSDGMITVAHGYKSSQPDDNFDVIVRLVSNPDVTLNFRVMPSHCCCAVDPSPPALTNWDNKHFDHTTHITDDRTRQVLEHFACGNYHQVLAFLTEIASSLLLLCSREM